VNFNFSLTFKGLMQEGITINISYLNFFNSAK